MHVGTILTTLSLGKKSHIPVEGIIGNTGALSSKVMVGGLVGWLVDRWVSCLIGWLVGGWVDKLFDWLFGGLTGCLVV